MSKEESSEVNESKAEELVEAKNATRVAPCISTIYSQFRALRKRTIKELRRAFSKKRIRNYGKASTEAKGKRHPPQRSPKQTHTRVHSTSGGVTDVHKREHTRIWDSYWYT